MRDRTERHGAQCFTHLTTMSRWDRINASLCAAGALLTGISELVSALVAGGLL